MRYQEHYQKISAGHFRPRVPFFDGIPCICKMTTLTSVVGDDWKTVPIKPIVAIGICTILEHFNPDHFKFPVGGNWEAMMQRQNDAWLQVEQWAKANNFCHYAAERESFSMREAMMQAHEGGYAGVIVEDLS